MAVSLAALIGGGLGGYWALQLLRPAPRQVAKGYYLETLHPGGIDIEMMTPIILTPLASEHVPESCPERLTVLGGDGTYAKGALPLFDAVGDASLEGAGEDVLCQSVAASLREQWAAFRSLLSAPPASPPLRVLIKHAPRTSLPGRCFTIHVTLFTSPDPYFDTALFQQAVRRMQAAEGGGRVPGVLIDLRKTYQLASGEPRMIEASLEIHAEVIPGVQRMCPPEMLRESGLPEMWADRAYGAHFAPYGGGERLGVQWIDLSAGIGEAQPWARAFRFTARSRTERPLLKSSEPPVSFVGSLKDLVARF